MVEPDDPRVFNMVEVTQLFFERETSKVWGHHVPETTGFVCDVRGFNKG